MMSLPKIAASAAMLAFFAGTDAEAAGKRFCNDYAGTSVEQFNRAQELGLSVAAPRWHGAFDLHQAWCRFVSEAAAQHEIDERQAVLDASTSAADAGDPPLSDDAGDPPLPEAVDPPLPAPVNPPSYSGTEEDPGSALSDGGPPLSAPVDGPHAGTTEPPLTAPVNPPSDAGSGGGSALSDGGAPLTAPVTPTDPER